MRIARILFITFLIGFALTIIWNFSNPVSTPRGPLPPLPFLGYASPNVTRIDEGINLTRITIDAKSAGYQVIYNDYLDELVEGYSYQWLAHTNGPVGGSSLVVEYSEKGNLTLFSYIYPAITKDANEWLWIRLSRYMHIERSIIQQKARNVTYQGDGTQALMRGEPDWSEIKVDLGALTKIDSSGIGYVFEWYDSGGMIEYSTPYIIIRAEKTVELNLLYKMPVILVIYLDQDGDMTLGIECKDKLPDPMSLFPSVFQSIHLQASTLSRIKLQEEYAAYL